MKLNLKFETKIFNLKSKFEIVNYAGPDIVHSTHGLLTTVAYQQEGHPATYALEGSVAVAGLALRWLRDNMGMIKDFK